MRLGLLCVALQGVAFAPAQTGRPRWNHSNTVLRVQARIPSDQNLPGVIWRLLRWPAGELPTPRPAAYAAYTAGDSVPVPCEVVLDDGPELWLRVALPTGERREREVRVYAAPPTNAVPVVTNHLDGVAIAIHRVSAISPPATHARMRHLLEGVNRLAYAGGAPDFETLDIEAAALRGLVMDQENERRRLGGDWNEERQTRARRRTDETRRALREQRWLVLLASWVHVTAPGEYRFELESASSAFLELDGAPIAGVDGESDARVARSASLSLAAGVHRIAILAYAWGGFEARLRWCGPEQPDAFVPIPAARLLGGWLMDEPRVDRSDRSLHADFNLLAMPSYRLRGVPGPFTPVRLQNASENWVTHGMTYLWYVDGLPVTNGPSATLILAGAGAHAIGLEVRDTYGFTHTRTRMLETPVAPLRAYAVAGALEGVPAIGGATDILRPAIIVSGRAEPRMVFDLDWRVSLADRQAYTGSRTVTVTGATVVADLPPLARARLTGIEWSLSHAGVPVARGACRSWTPVSPAGWRAEGAALFDAGGAQVLVTLDEPPRSWPADAMPATPRRVLCVDDSLYPATADATESFDQTLGRLLAGAVEVARYTPPAWDAASDAWAPLAEWAAVVGAVQTGRYDAVLLCVGAQARGNGMAPEDFGRHLAALAEGARAAGAAPRVVLATLPVAAGPSSDARAYAVATRAVAAARGAPVADLYTTFAAFTAAGRRPMDERGRLTAEGRALAAQALARALLASPPGGD